MSENMLQKIEGFLEGVSLKSLLISTKDISDEYRATGRADPKEEDILAYLVTRMPATYAALCRVFQEIQRRLPHFTADSLLDIGCGPGTTLWAATEFFPQLKDIYCLENNAHFLATAKRLAEDLECYPHVQWLAADATRELPSCICDLVIASYSLGEIADGKRSQLMKELWKRTKKVLVLLEPGTPKGFERLCAARKQLIEAGAYLIAPCPHSGECPLSEGDWCHFYARLNRSSLHRRAKQAQLGYEDEKFSYMLFSKEPSCPSPSRILRHPRKGKGHVQLTLCTSNGVQESIVTKKERDLYKIARKADWGDGHSG